MIINVQQISEYPMVHEKLCVNCKNHGLGLSTLFIITSHCTGG